MRQINYVSPPESWVRPTALSPLRVLITGVSGGLGSALSYRLKQMGMQLVLLARSVRALEKLDDDLAGLPGPSPVLLPLDLEGATPEDYAKVCEQLQVELGGLDAVIHAAWFFRALQPVAHMRADDWLKAMQINVHGPLWLTQGLWPLLQESAGVTIFTLDHLDQVTGSNWAAYGAAKAALTNLMLAWAGEIERQGPSIYGVHPGPMRTQLRAKMYGGEDPDSIREPSQVLLPYIYALFERPSLPLGSILTDCESD